MNERIRQLADEATSIVEMVGPEGYTSSYANFDKEKFAELIVKECLDACSRANEIRHFVPPTQQQVVLSCMREIETTFRS
jgi:hypothetical protein